MVNKLRVRVHFKSGRTLDLSSENYIDTQFRLWLEHQFKKPDGNTYQFVVWGDSFVNIYEIEYIEQVK